MYFIMQNSHSLGLQRYTFLETDTYLGTSAAIVKNTWLEAREAILSKGDEALWLKKGLFLSKES